MTCTVVKLRDPLDLSTREVYQAGAGVTVQSLVDGCGDGHWAAFVNGERIESEDLDRVVSDRDFVGLINMPQGPLVAALPYLLIAFVSGYIAYRLIDRDIPDVRGDEGSPTYSFSGIGNNRTEGFPIPVVYGKHRTGGTIISEFAALSGSENMTVSQLIVVSEGPIYGFGQNPGDLLTDTTSSGPVQGQDIPIGFRIDEAEAQNLVESNIQTRLGNNVQSAMSGFNVISNETPYGIRLNSQETTSIDNNVLLFTDGAWETDYATVDSAFDQYATTFRLDDQDYDSFTTRVEFPQGLAKVDTQGNYFSSNFQLAVRYRKLDTSGLPILTGGPGGDGWLYEPFPPAVQAATRQRLLRENSFPLRDPGTYSNGGGITAGKIFDPGSTGTDGELRSTFSAGHSWRNYWTDISSFTLGSYLAQSAGSNHVRFMIQAPSNAMNAFVLGGVYKVDMSRLVDDQFPRLAVLAQIGDPVALGTGVRVAAVAQAGSSDLELRMLLRFGGTTIETVYTIPNYDESWMRVEYRQTLTGKNGAPPPNWNGGTNWQYQPMGLRHSLWVNGVEVDHRQYNSEPHEFFNVYGFVPVIRQPGTLDGIYCKTLDAVYIDEIYYGETGSAYSTNGFGTQLYISSSLSPFQPPVDSALTTSIVNRTADEPGCATYLFDVNTGTGPTSYASASIYGDYAGDLQLQQGNGTIGVTDGIVLSSGSTAISVAGRYECQALRVNVDSSHDRCFDDSVLDAVIGIRNKTLTYPACALVGQKVRATDQLNSQKPRMTTVVWGRLVPTLYGAAPAYAYSSNPAWVAADLLLNKRIGLGNRYSINNIDLDSIREWARYCDEIVYDGGRQYTANNAGLATSTDWDDLLFDNSTADPGGIARGSLTLYLKQTSSVDFLPFTEGSFVRLHGFPSPEAFPLGVLNDINNGAVGSNTPGGYQVKSAEEDPLNANRWKITLWWDRLEEPDPWTSGTLLSTAVTADGGDQNDITGATVEGGETRHQFNGVFDKEYNVWDALLAVCQAGRAKPVMTGSTVRFSVDKPRTPIGMIGMGAIKTDSFEVDYAGPKSRANSYEVVLFPESNDWERATEIVNDPDLSDPTQFDQFRRESIQTQGITSRGQARREGIFRIKSNKLRLRSGKMTLGPEALSFEPGDVIYLSHDIMCRGVSGRVLSTNVAASAAQQFEIDRDITIESGKVYLVYVRDHESDEVASASIATINGAAIAPGNYSAGSTIRFTQAIPFLAVAGKTTWSLVVSGEELQVEITGINMKENLEHEVEWLEYNAEVYEDAITEPLPEQQFLDGSGSGTSNAIGGAVLAAYSVSVSETNARAAGDTYEPGFEISWRYNRAHSRYIKGFKVLQKRNASVPAGGMMQNGALDDYRVVAEGQGLATHATIRAENCARGNDVEFRVYLYGDFPSLPPDYCDGARVIYRGVGPTPSAPASASMRYNEERAIYYARQSDNQFRQQIEWRRGSWILGDRIGRITAGDTSLGPTDNWSGAVSGATNLYAATVTPLGQYSEPLLSQQAPAPILDEIAFDATWQSQAWEDYEDGWKTDSLPPAYDPQLSNLQRHADGYLEFTGTSLTGTYTTANELLPAPRAQQIIRPVRVFLQAYWEATQVHPASWDWAPNIEWRDNSAAQWTWEGPLSDGIYPSDNCTVECQARFSEDGLSWGDWLPLTPGMYAITAVQFRLVATRATPGFNVQISKFHTTISQRFRTVTDRDRMTAFIEREII